MLRLHLRPGESASLKMELRQVVFEAPPSDSGVHPGWRTRATAKCFFNLFGCVLESPGEIF